MSILPDHLDAKYAFPTQCVLKRTLGYFLNSIPPIEWLVMLGPYSNCLDQNPDYSLSLNLPSADTKCTVLILFPN